MSMLEFVQNQGYNHLISNKHEFKDCFLIADFALQEQPEDNLMVAISRLL